MTAFSTALNASFLKPLSRSPPEQLVILLHGYGSNGDDLISLGKYWQKLLPTTEFAAFNAPFPCSEFAHEKSYQWFDLGDFNHAVMHDGISEIVPVLNSNIDTLLGERGLSDEDLALVGFSQGAIMALSGGVSRKRPCAGVIGYSGAFIHSPEDVVTALPEILLIHGDLDPVVDIKNLSQSAKILTSLGAKVRTHVCLDLDHSIDQTGLTMGGQFLAENFTKKN